MKKIVAIILAGVMVVASLAACGGSGGGGAKGQGKVFNIYAWNEEFKGFFEKYYTVPEGVEVK